MTNRNNFRAAYARVRRAYNSQFDARSNGEAVSMAFAAYAARLAMERAARRAGVAGNAALAVMQGRMR